MIETYLNNRTAYHEAAHALVGRLLRCDVGVVTTLGNRAASGHTFVEPPDSPDSDHVQLIVLAAGRAGEAFTPTDLPEVVPVENEITKRAQAILSESEREEAIHERKSVWPEGWPYATCDQITFWSICVRLNMGDYSSFQSEWQRRVEQARGLLANNEATFHCLAGELIRRQILFSKDIQEIVSGIQS